MSTLELQQTLAEEITLIQDVDFLNALKSIIDAKLSVGVYQLSDYQKERVAQARMEREKGLLIDSDEMFNEFDKWLDTE